jgi:DNA polymerase III alpha subunit
LPCPRDVLALGMLTAIRKSLAFIGMRKGYAFAMHDIPAEDQTWVRRALRDRAAKASTAPD